jgi:trans-2,3-dihydro-3-hydroxyanthranilate isomerase
MKRRYVTVDVFTNRAFGGNPLAVVLDAQGLNTAQMQAIAAEFNYAETTFVLPPADTKRTAHVRIFTPRTEVPFAGHPNVGTAVVFAREQEGRGGPPLDQLVFEEAAGLVPIQLIREGDTVVGAEFRAPETLTLGSKVSAANVAECLSLTAADINLRNHPPQVLSVGLPFLVAEIASREALRRAKPDTKSHERILPPMGTDALYAYCPCSPHCGPNTESCRGAYTKVLRWADPVCFRGGRKSATAPLPQFTSEDSPCKLCPECLIRPPRPKVDTTDR